MNQGNILPAALPEGQARVVVTYDGQTGDLADPIHADTSHPDVLRMVQEALRAGGIRGIEAKPTAELRDFIVDPAEPNELHPYRRLLVRPKTAFGHEGHGHEKERAKGKTTLRPLGDRVLLKRGDKEERTPGGIIIPDTAKEKPQECIVRAVGRGKLLDNGKLLEPSVKAGDRVLVGKYSGNEIEIDGEKLLVTNEDEILGVVES